MVEYTDLKDVVNNEGVFNEVDKSKIILFLEEFDYDMSENHFLSLFDSREQTTFKKCQTHIPTFVYNVLLNYYFNNKIRLLSSTRYTGIIERYFDHILSVDLNMGSQYEEVYNNISELWINSDKNPSIFKTAKDFEPILQKRKEYRDHFIHSFNVFLIGYYIMNKLDDSLFKVDIVDINAVNNNTDKNLIWMLTSTFHDIAYPIQEIENWLNTFFCAYFGINLNYRLNISNMLPPIYTDFMKMLSSYNKNSNINSIYNVNYNTIDWSFFDEINSGTMRKDHGIISSLILTHFLAIREKWMDDPTRSKNFLINHIPACHAICLHNLNNPISFDKHPFAFLLALCDEIQDWGRPSMDDNRDIFFLNKIIIDNGTIPEIKFFLKISDSRIGRLKINLSQHRMCTDSKIKVTIYDQKENEILKLE
jgi:hypothetical protein